MEQDEWRFKKAWKYPPYDILADNIACWFADVILVGSARSVKERDDPVKDD